MEPLCIGNGLVGLDTPSEGLVKINVLSKDHALSGVTNKIYVLFEIVTKEKPKEKERPPFELSIVLDRSSSMSGLKITNCKEAAKTIVDYLTPADRLNFVVYDTEVETIFQRGTISQKEDLKSAIDAIRPTGCTNLSGGLQAGADVLNIEHEDHVPGTGKRIFLFSDGLPNRGITNRGEVFALVDKIRTHDINVSSYGIGDDFDEDMMKGIGEHGGGDYFFIDTAEKIPILVSRGLSGLLSLIGTNAVLQLRGVNGAIVKKIFMHDNIVKGAQLNDLRENDSRQILAEVEFSPTSNSPTEFLNYTLQYYLPGNAKEPKILSGTHSIHITNDSKLVVLENNQVLVSVTISQNGENDKEVIRLMDAGKVDAAIKLKQISIEEMEKVVHLDQSGMLASLITSAKKSLAAMKERDVKLARKNVQYSSYQCEQQNAFYFL